MTQFDKTARSVRPSEVSCRFESIKEAISIHSSHTPSLNAGKADPN
jgi:hypothetical protein